MWDLIRNVIVDVDRLQRLGLAYHHRAAGVITLVALLSLTAIIVAVQRLFARRRANAVVLPAVLSTIPESSWSAIRHGSHSPVPCRPSIFCARTG